MIMGKGMCMLENGIIGKSLYLLLNFAVNLKQFKK